VIRSADWPPLLAMSSGAAPGLGRGRPGEGGLLDTSDHGQNEIYKVTRYRDGLNALVNPCPMRLMNLAGLVIGQPLVVDGQQYRVSLTTANSSHGRRTTLAMRGRAGFSCSQDCRPRKSAATNAHAGQMTALVAFVALVASPVFERIAGMCCDRSDESDQSRFVRLSAGNLRDRRVSLWRSIESECDLALDPDLANEPRHFSRARARLRSTVNPCRP
jgi:hypothetical protein